MIGTISYWNEGPSRRRNDGAQITYYFAPVGSDEDPRRRRAGEGGGRQGTTITIHFREVTCKEEVEKNKIAITKNDMLRYKSLTGKEREKKPNGKSSFFYDCKADW